MASITIRRLDERTKSQLRMRAAQHGRSMEEEARNILKAALAAGPRPAKQENLYDSIRRLVEPLGGFELELPPRQMVGGPPKFDE